MHPPKPHKFLLAGHFILKVLRWLVLVFTYSLCIYGVFALISAAIPIHAEELSADDPRRIKMYLLKSGPHTDFLVQVKTAVHDWSVDFPYSNNENPDTALPWLAIGWGDKGFYLNTPTWGDLTCKTAVSAAAGLGTAGIHASYYYTVPDDRPLVQLELTDMQYRRLCQFVRCTLVADEHGNRVVLHPQKPGINFGHDRYYDAYGTYSMIHTCNTWINNGLKASGQRACLWTGFAEAIFYQYDK